MDKVKFINEVLPLRKKLTDYSLSFLRSKEDSEDITQEVLLKLWSIRDTLERYDNIQALSFQITKHLCLNKIKNPSYNQCTTDDIVISNENSLPDKDLIDKDNSALVNRIIDQLPSLQQTIIKMKHIEGLEVKEIAELTGSNPEAIRMNLSRARKHIKELFLNTQNYENYER